MDWARQLIMSTTRETARRESAESSEAGGSADGAATAPESSVWRETAFVWILALLSLFLHLATASRYEFYIDELYGIVSSNHSLACCAEIFPLQLWLTRLSTCLLGCSPFAVRLLPAVAGSANILVAGLLARELGGKLFAVSLTGLGVFVAPMLVFVAGSAYAWSYEGLLWSLSAMLVVRALRTGNGRLWWLVGMAWGFSLLNKPTALLFILGVGFGLLATRARGEILRKGYWLALAVAFVLSSPVWIWQAAHGWPVFGAIGGMSSDEYAESASWLAYFSRSKMILAQPAFLGPLNFVLAVAGVFYGLVFGRETASRVFLWACVAAALAFVAVSGHPSYLNPLYALLVASGCVAAARISAGKRVRWMRPALVAGLVVQGLVIAPLCVSILPKGLLDGYSRLICRGMLAPLSNTAAILLGTDASDYEIWAGKLHGACGTLPAGGKTNCCIIVGYAPFAFAAEFYDAQYRYRLPRVFSPHLNCAFWGPPDEGTELVIAFFFNRKELEGWFGRVEPAGKTDEGIYICRIPKCTYQKMWQEMCNKDPAFRWKVERGPWTGVA